MVFLRAFGLTRFTGSQQTRSGSAACARRQRSTRFLQTKGRCSGIKNRMWGNCQGPWDTPYRRRPRAHQMRAACVCLHAWRTPGPFQRARKRSHERGSRHEATMNARHRCVHVALIKVHGEIDYYGAHRLPAGKTAANRRERGRPAGQAAKLFEGRLLQVSKALAPLVKIFEF
jgi:hypothetical protein